MLWAVFFGPRAGVVVVSPLDERRAVAVVRGESVCDLVASSSSDGVLAGFRRFGARDGYRLVVVAASFAGGLGRAAVAGAGSN